MKTQQKKDSNTIRKNIIINIYCMQSLFKASSLELFCILLLDSFVSMCRKKVWEYSLYFFFSNQKEWIYLGYRLHRELSRWVDLGYFPYFFDMRNHSYQNNSCYFQLNQPESKIIPMYLFHCTFLATRTRDSSDIETLVLINSDG